jgi:hypothetical protein
MRDTDKKIAEWLGYEVEPLNMNSDYRWMASKQDKLDAKLDGGVDPYLTPFPHYSTEDADAITLLPVLVERGYTYCLTYDEECQEHGLAIFEKGD